MKKAMMIILFGVTFGCNSTKDKTNEDKKNNEVGVPNVNGNIPDTTNAINLSTHKKDSSQKSDSVK